MFTPSVDVPHDQHYFPIYSPAETLDRHCRGFAADREDIDALRALRRISK